MKQEQTKKQTQPEQAQPITNGTNEETPAAIIPDKIYNNNIMVFVDDFIDTEYAGLTRTELKHDKSFFPALIQFLNVNCIPNILNNTKGQPNNRYNNITLLDDIFNIYVSLVYKYKHNNRPTLTEFSILTGINIDTFYSWLNKSNSIDIYNNSGVVDNNCNSNNNIKGKPDGRKHITPRYPETVKKWLTVCESALLDGSDTIKELFILKSKYGYREQDSNVNITVNHKTLISADDLPALGQIMSTPIIEQKQTNTEKR